MYYNSIAYMYTLAYVPQPHLLYNLQLLLASEVTVSYSLIS